MAVVQRTIVILDCLGSTVSTLDSRLTRITHHGNNDFALMWCRAMFEEENPLPGAECHAAILNGYRLAGAGERHAYVAGHVVGSFQRMNEPRGAFRHELIKEGFQILPRRGIGVFHDYQAGAGVAHKHGDDTIADAGIRNGTQHLIGDFNQPFATGADADGGMANHDDDDGTGCVG